MHLDLRHEIIGSFIWHLYCENRGEGVMKLACHSTTFLELEPKRKENKPLQLKWEIRDCVGLSKSTVANTIAFTLTTAHNSYT